MKKILSAVMASISAPIMAGNIVETNDSISVFGLDEIVVVASAKENSQLRSLPASSTYKSVTFNLNTKHEADFKQTADKALAKGFSWRKPYHVVGSLSQSCCSLLHHSPSSCFDKNLPSA